MELVLNVLTYVFWVLLAIMILVFTHEMGHFLFAKLFRMRVEKFSIGFPPRLFSRRWGDTEYIIGATPLGGYVKISGMIDESLDTAHVAQPPQPWEFRAKPLWQRMLVISGGVLFNMLLAVGILTGLKWIYGEAYIPAENIRSVYVAEGSLAYEMGLRTGDQIIAVNGRPLVHYGDLRDLEALVAHPFTITVARGRDTLTFTGPPDLMTQLSRRGGFLGISVDPPLVGGVLEGSPAEKAGLKAGDRIVAVDSVQVNFWNELVAQVQVQGGQPLRLRWLRTDTLAGVPETTVEVARQPEGIVYEATLTPYFDPETDRYYLGIAAPTPAMLMQYFGAKQRRFGAGEALIAGLRDTWTHTRVILTSLGRMITGRESFRENVGGPIMIAKVTKEAAEAGARAFWNIVALLSITLAIVNFLPIPALDGGHMVFLLYEAVARREPSVRVRLALQQVGMMLLVALMAFLILNDLLRL
ncbi:RIP metalloprotease RseP [Rhodothermus bifroesti]|uniref:Zinc metalloprotease n=1 Tax=Rhodothermus marinus TaxID=29549 RepID=A0A7V2AYF5_RHOMR|nr:RIP metalloprotease RseP [Rhodothermus bifroesti]GBD01676.1 Putative zinc metalloprotease [bacterium HR18]